MSDVHGCSLLLCETGRTRAECKAAGTGREYSDTAAVPGPPAGDTYRLVNNLSLRLAFAFLHSDAYRTTERQRERISHTEASRMKHTESAVNSTGRIFHSLLPTQNTQTSRSREFQVYIRRTHQ